MEQLDVDRLQLSLSNLQVQIKTAERNAELALGLLEFRGHWPKPTELALTDSLNGLLSDTEKELAVSPLQYVKEGIANRYEIKALQTEKNAPFGYSANKSQIFAHSCRIFANPSRLPIQWI